MNFSLEKLVKNLSDFKFLTQEFGSENLELLNKRILIHMRTWTVLKDLANTNYLIKNIFTDLEKLKQLVTMLKN